MIVELVPGNPPQPGPEVFAPAKGTQALECGDENLLGQVIHLIEVMQLAGQVTADGQPVEPDHAHEGLGIPAQNAVNDGFDLVSRFHG